MMIGVVLLVGYMMFSNKRVSSTSSYSKQMKVNFWRSLEGPFLVLGLEVCKPVVKSWTLPTAGGFKLNVDADQYVVCC
ncbi:hypothetical protein QYF36_021196 [Acer negundo]|nr:hypothetical protein QYF36_021196 [Acer negundo]